MKITIIHPSRSRHVQAIATHKAWMSSAKNPENIDYFFSVDEDDTALPLYAESIFRLELKARLIINPNTTAIEAINNAASQINFELLIVVSDDFNQPPLRWDNAFVLMPFHWDSALISMLEGKSDFIVKTNDGLQPWIMTLPIMDRVYYDRFGYVYYPGYKHMFSDTEMTHVADLLDRKITLPITIPHNHYSTGRILKDGINAKNDSTWSQGEKLYLERLAKDFDLVNYPGMLRCDPGHISWLTAKGIQIESV